MLRWVADELIELKHVSERHGAGARNQAWRICISYKRICHHSRRSGQRRPADKGRNKRATQADGHKGRRLLGGAIELARDRMKSIRHKRDGSGGGWPVKASGQAGARARGAP